MNLTPSSLLAEVREADADEATRALYEEMKRLGGVPMVALIFRHLATRPGVLPWAWAAVGPAWRSGRLQETAWGIARETPLEPLEPISRASLAAAGVDEAGEREIREVYLAYNRANPENQLTVLCLVRLLAGASRSAPLESRAWVPPSAPVSIAPMADPATVSSRVAALFDRVADAGEAVGDRVVQSLYRHFAHRPDFLALAVQRIAPRIAEGGVASAARTLHQRMDAEAATIVRTLEAPPVPDASVEAVLRRFGERVIPGMIVAGALLERAMPSP